MEDQEIEELLESWINGNYSHVASVLRGKSRGDIMRFSFAASEVGRMFSPKACETMSRMIDEGDGLPSRL